MTARALPPFKPWPEFLEWFRAHWRPRPDNGQQVTLLGANGSGKTVLAKAILPLRRAVLVLATKPRDPELTALRRDGYVITRRLPLPPSERIVLWPEVRDTIAHRRHQAEVFYRALDQVYRQGLWTVYCDELRYLARDLGLGVTISTLMTQGRSMGINMVVGTQRPAFVPLEAYSEAWHLFLWRGADHRNRQRLAEVSGAVDVTELRRVMGQLGRHEALYVSTRGGEVFRTQVDL